jgi:hypothetical protein
MNSILVFALLGCSTIERIPPALLLVRWKSQKWGRKWESGWAWSQSKWNGWRPWRRSMGCQLQVPTTTELFYCPWAHTTNTHQKKYIHITKGYGMVILYYVKFLCVCVCVCVLQQHVFTCCRTAKIAFFAWQARHFVLWYCTLNNTRMMHPTVLLRLAPKSGRSSNCWCGLLGCALKAFCFKTKQASRKWGELGHSCSSFLLLWRVAKSYICMYVCLVSKLYRLQTFDTVCHGLCKVA